METVKYSDGRDWSRVKAKIMFKEYNEVMAMDIVKKIPNWPKTGWKHFEQLHKFLQWIVAVYDPNSPLQVDYRGEIKGKRKEAAKIVGFEFKKDSWKPKIYHDLIEGSLPIEEIVEEEEDEEEKDYSEKRIIRMMMKCISGYLIYASGHKWRNLCAYENYYVELYYQINNPLSADKSKDLMQALATKDKMVSALERTSELIEKTWDEILQEDKELQVYMEHQMPLKPENN